MRILTALAAAVLSWAAAGEARALTQDLRCKYGVGTAEQRVNACTRFIEQNKPAFMTGPYIADALATRGVARAERADCAGGIIDINAAIDLTASYTSPTVQRLRYEMHHSGAVIYLNCAGDFDGALAILGRATKLKPAEPLAFADRGLVFSEKGDFKAAFAELAKAQSLAYDNAGRANVLRLRALVLQRQGRLDEAITDFDEAIRLNPGFGSHYAGRGNVWRLKGDLARALTDLSIAVRLDPESANVVARRGEILRYRGDLSAALADFNKALTLNPNSVQALAGRGLIYEKLGDSAQARANFEGAVGSPMGNVSWVREPRETARARLAALDSGAATPVIPAVPATAASATSVPTPAIAAPILTKPVAAVRDQAGLAKQGRRVALVVGNSAYRRVPELINPKGDAEAIAASLRNVGFDAVMLVADASREKLLEALRAFANEVETADWAMVYYAGHGIEVNGRNFLIPVDAKLAADRDVQFETVPLEQVMASLEGAKKLRLVVLDACRDNPFTPLMRRTTVAEAAAVPTIAGPTRMRSIGRGLGEVKVQGASLVVFAAKHGQTALDGEGGNSPFAIALVQRIATPGVEINKIFRLVRDDVMEATAGRQEPYTYGSLPGREDFFFVAAK